MVVEGLSGCILPVGATGNSSKRLFGSMFICGGLGGKVGASHSAIAGGVELGSDAEGIG